MLDSVSKVLSIFEKLIARLEKIKEREEAKAAKQRENILKAKELERWANAEVVSAEKAIEKLKNFLE